MRRSVGARDAPRNLHNPRALGGMHSLVAILVPLVIIVVVAIIIIAVTERFSPDPLITTIVRWVVFAVVIIALLTKLVPLLGIA